MLVTICRLLTIAFLLAPISLTAQTFSADPLLPGEHAALVDRIYLRDSPSTTGKILSVIPADKVLEVTEATKISLV